MPTPTPPPIMTPDTLQLLHDVLDEARTALFDRLRDAARAGLNCTLTEEESAFVHAAATLVLGNLARELNLRTSLMRSLYADFDPKPEPFTDTSF